MFRQHSSNGKSGHGKSDEAEAKKRLLDSNWSDSDESEVDFDASKVLEKPVTIQAAKHAQKRHRSRSCRCGPTEQSLFSMLVVSVLLVFFLMGCLGWMYLKQLTQICLTPECIQVSARMSQLMDTSTSPCDDLYNFTCGKFHSLHPIPSLETTWSWFAILRNKNNKWMSQVLETVPLNKKFRGAESSAFKKSMLFYRACMNEHLIAGRGKAPLLQLVEEHGGWTLTNDTQTKWQRNNFDLTKLLIKLHPKVVSALFELLVMVDEKTHVHAIEFAASGLTLSDRDYYSEKSRPRLREAVGTFAIDFARLLGTPEEAMMGKFFDIFRFESDIAQYHPPRESVNDPWKMYNKIKLSELKEKMGNMIDLDAYMEAIFGKKIPSETLVRISFPEYFVKIAALVERTDLEIVNNYLMWHLIQNRLSYMPSEFRNAYVRFKSIETGSDRPVPKWELCISKTGRLMGFVLSSLYVEKFGDQKKIDMAKTIVGYVRESLKETIEDVKWMDEKTRNYALKKLANMGEMVGYPDWITKPEKLDEFYENLTVIDHAFDNAQFAAEFSFRRNIERLGTLPDKEEWSMFPHQQNAYYSITYNQVVILAGLLESPFLDLSFPMAVNFGSLGMFIGHEMSHGFDIRGRNYDEQGRLKKWWTDGVEERYLEKTDEMIMAYSKYGAYGVKLNSNFTVGENAADGGGLAMAYSAHRKWASEYHSTKKLPGLDYTDDQMFFIGFGQAWCANFLPSLAKIMLRTSAHPLNYIRVIGSASNAPEFAQTFHCPKSSPMNPEKKCGVW